ncbi:maleylpyruvate isomerase family mycothiol-dependent enzyme [Streptacidiphilus cavernicola]|uniref:Maleylpyruvate isomerase family mycothiol-dependent enzyme n=1 Tax=Streptacidiphilus cavernicola TaxID=3342716 RepID=A0ABV6W5W4_9ACTN
MTAPGYSLADSLTAAAGSAERLLRTVERMRPEQVLESSALPGWTRGHVLTHISRNADGLGNLLRGARTSQPIPMYPSPESRERGIQDGAKRTLAEQLADLRASGLRFTTATEAMPDAAWAVEVPHRTGPFPASDVPLKRIAEVEYHHVDLGLDYTPAQWPEPFVARELASLAGRYRGAADLPPMLLRDSGTGAGYELGSGTRPPLELGAPAWALLAWLSGRSDGSGLSVPVADLPQLPPMS